MKFSTRLAKTTLAGAISIAASWAIAAPVDVTFSTSGSEGDWLLDFTVSNNIVTPADMSVYFFGVQLASGSMVGSPFAFTPLTDPLTLLPSDGGPETTLDFGWLDFELAGGGASHLAPFESLGGFVLHSDSFDAPTSISWAALAIHKDADPSDDDPDAPPYISYQGVAGVPAIPEPSTYALMFLGVAALGLFKIREQTNRRQG